VPLWPISHPPLSLSYQERLYYAALEQPLPSNNILASIPRCKTTEQGGDKKENIHYFNIDNELVYWNYFLDFGPLNLGQLYRFSHKLNDKLLKFPVVCFYSNTVPAKRANAIFLICAWQLLYLDRTPKEAYRGFNLHLDVDLVGVKENGSKPPVSDSQGAVTIGPLPHFRDASQFQCIYDLTILDCLQGMAKARTHGFFDVSTFDVEEYKYYEQVEVCIHDCGSVCRVDQVGAMLVCLVSYIEMVVVYIMTCDSPFVSFFLEW
jgi:hypothetical protein